MDTRNCRCSAVLQDYIECLWSHIYTPSLTISWKCSNHFHLNTDSTELHVAPLSILMPQGHLIQDHLMKFLPTNIGQTDTHHSTHLYVIVFKLNAILLSALHHVNVLLSDLPISSSERPRVSITASAHLLAKTLLIPLIPLVPIILWQPYPHILQRSFVKKLNWE